MLNTLLRHFFNSKADIRVRPDGAPAPEGFYRFSLRGLDGQTVVDFEQFRGRQVLLVNVASRCGFTPQYAQLQALHEEMGERLAMLACPANNFLWQEPGDAGKIAEFCRLNYGVTFPISEKIDVIGPHQHPLYRWLSQARENGWNEQTPSWNFCKYIIDAQGRLTHYFGPKITPEHPAFRKALGL